MEVIISNLITTLGAFILVYLSVIKDTHASKYQIIREQLDKFYIPFYQMYCRGFLSELPLSSMSQETRGKFLDLLSNNLHLMEPLSQSLFLDFYKAFLDLLEAENGNKNFPLSKVQSRFDSIFKNLSDNIFMEYNHLLKKAKLLSPIFVRRKRHFF